MYAAKLEAYRTVQKAGRSDREIEAAVLTRAALKLKACQDAWGQEGNPAELKEALQLNQTIWSVFQSELVRPDHPMPKKLREEILSLARFIDKRMLEVLTAPDPRKLKVLIDINMNLAAGLQGSAA